MPASARRQQLTRELDILVLGDHGSQLAGLSERIRSMGFRAIRAKTPADAIELAGQRGYCYAVGLLEPGIAALDLGLALSDLRARSGRHDLVFLATGPRPDPDERARLRQGGVELALWQPVNDHALLFHLNRTARLDPAAGLRSEQRVPTDWSSRVMVAGRAKRATVYSLSGGGAFLATERPSMRGAEMAIDLPLPGGAISLLGRVLYTNVPGNRYRRHLPTGMGVQFLRTPGSDHAAICRAVAEAAARYYI